MRCNLLVVVLVLLIVSCNDNKGSVFTVSGSIKNQSARMIYLEESNIATAQKTLKDSARVEADGKFSFKTKTTAETIYNLRLDEEAYPFVSLINDAASVTVDADFKNEKEFYTVKGSVASQGIKDYLTKSGEKIRSIYELHKATDGLNNINDNGVSNSLEKRNKEIKDLKTYTEQAVQEAKSSTLALFILSTYQGMANNPNFNLDPFSNDHLLGLLNVLANKFPERTEIVTIRNTVENQLSKNSIETQAGNSGWVGKPAPEISLPDTEGKTIKLSSYRGKYVLVDFWASWCRPCRMENPNVVDAFNKYRNKNFTILGVSLDSKKEAWQNAIVVDNLNWTHISDLKQWSSEVVPLYGIQGIPFNVLVDPTGKVVAENLRGMQLDQKLSEVLQ